MFIKHLLRTCSVLNGAANTHEVSNVCVDGVPVVSPVRSELKGAHDRGNAEFDSGGQ